jgi:hypothetical protein
MMISSYGCLSLFYLVSIQKEESALNLGVMKRESPVFVLGGLPDFSSVHAYRRALLTVRVF